MKYNLSEIMNNAWTYRGDGLTQSEALKQAWKDVKTSKEMLFELKNELEEQLKCVQYQIDQLENPEPKKYTMPIIERERDNVKVWGAIITGLDKKYGFKREFKSYRYINDCSSKHAYYNYYIDAEEGQIIEIGINSAYKNKRYYYICKKGEFESIEVEEIRGFLNEQKIS